MNLLGILLSFTTKKYPHFRLCNRNNYVKIIIVFYISNIFLLSFFCDSYFKFLKNNSSFGYKT